MYEEDVDPWSETLKQLRENRNSTSNYWDKQRFTE
jgi:hypothetical protein